MMRFWMMGLLVGTLTGLAAGSLAGQETKKPIVIAHRGASGYVPEHTEAAKVLAYAQGADFIEQDVVLTRDHVLVVCHDIHLQETTNVAEKFPDRRRSDGAWYMADLDWSEVAQLSVLERRNREGKPAFAGRFPGGFHQHLMRLEDELALLQGLNKTLGRNVGIYVELKRPAWHREQLQVDMADLLLKTLSRFGYSQADDRCYVQCFEHAELQHLKQDLHCRLPLIALLGGRPKGEATPPDYAKQMSELAKFVVGIGPSLDMLIEQAGPEIKSSGLVEAAHKAGLKVHPYTVRQDALPKWSRSTDHLHEVLLKQLQVDGFFTDFPDLGRQAVDGIAAVK